MAQGEAEGAGQRRRYRAGGVPADAGLIDALPPLQRLALAYAPRGAREPTLALFALDTRLAAIVRAAREPMMAQLRLAWWREQLRVPVAAWPAGEPLLAALRGWAGEAEALVTLVDGWEAMTGAAPLAEAGFTSLARARGGGFAALARICGAHAAAAEADRAGTGWALADMAARLSHADERAHVAALVATHDWSRPRLPRALRPLAVLHGLAARTAIPGHDPAASPRRALLTSMRIGLLGR